MTLEMTSLSSTASVATETSPSTNSLDALPSRKHHPPSPPDEGLPIGEDTYFVEAPAGVERLRSKDLYACLGLSKRLGVNVVVKRQSDGKLLAYKSAFSLASRDGDADEG
jgi:hypothetical protein